MSHTIGPIAASCVDQFCKERNLVDSFTLKRYLYMYFGTRYDSYKEIASAVQHALVEWNIPNVNVCINYSCNERPPPKDPLIIAWQMFDISHIKL